MITRLKIEGFRSLAKLVRKAPLAGGQLGAIGAALLAGPVPARGPSRYLGTPLPLHSLHSRLIARNIQQKGRLG